MRSLHRPVFISALLLILAASGLVGSSAAAAPRGENITASPTQITPNVVPGGSTSGAATIINDGDQAYDFKAYAAPYHVAGEDYDQSFSPAGGPADASPWVKLPERSYHLEPHASLNVPYTIAVPSSAGGGGYYAVMFFETLPRVTAGSGVSSRRRVGIVVYLRVEGAVIPLGSVAGFTAKFLQPGAPLTAELRLRNTGNVHYGADVTAQVTDIFGRTKFTARTRREILPGTTRRIGISWDKAPGFGLFKVGGSVDMVGRTEQLPLRFVLMLSAGAFLAAAAALVLLAGLIWWWRAGRRRPRK